jgi:hypothetical protein
MKGVMKGEHDGDASAQWRRRPRSEFTAEFQICGSHDP